MGGNPILTASRSTVCTKSSMRGSRRPLMNTVGVALTWPCFASWISAARRSRALAPVMQAERAAPSRPAPAASAVTSAMPGFVGGPAKTRSWYAQNLPWSCAHTAPSARLQAPA